MRIETLNKIKHFSVQPSKKELALILSQIDSDIEEEFLWITAFNQNKIEIYKLMLELNSNYFDNKLLDLNADNYYGHLHFRIFRYLIELAKTVDKKDSLFDHLNKTIQLLITTYQQSQNQQIHLFIAELIIELPLKLINDKYILFLTKFSFSKNISFIGSLIVEKLIPRIILERNSDILYKVLDQLVFSIQPEDYKNAYSRVGYDGYNVSHLLNEKTISDFAETIGKERLIDFSISKLQSLAEKVPYNFSYLNISTIEDSSQILDKDKYEFILVKFLRIQLELIKIPDLILDKLLQSNLGILQRLGIYYINKNYEDYRLKFWNVATPKFLINHEIKHETFMLLQENSKSHTKKEIETFISNLEELRTIVINENLNDEEVLYYNSVIAKEYLLALNNCDEEVKKLINSKIHDLDKIVKGTISHPGYNVYVETGISLDKEREEYNVTFSKSDLPMFFELAENGFQDMPKTESLKLINRVNYLIRRDVSFVLDNQERFIKIGLENFFEIPSFFEKAWVDKAQLDWAEVFKFFGKVIDLNYSKNPQVYQQFIGYCSWFIRSATRNDEHPLTGDALIEAKDLCLKFLKLRIENECLNQDPFFDILNNTDGKIFDATITLLLQNARLNKNKEDKDKWFPDIKNFYTESLEKGIQTEALIWSISMHLPQFGYLDMGWLDKHMDQIFPMDKPKLWQLAMRSYHKYCKTVYRVIYDNLIKNGHYDKALTVFKNDQPGTDDVFEHTSIAFSANWKGTEIDNREGIIYKILQIGDRSQLFGLISSFTKNKSLSKEKMFELWGAILKSPSVQNKIIYNDLLLLVSSLKSIDETSFALIKETLYNITTNQAIDRLIYNLFDIKEGNPIYKAQVLLEINDPDFEQFINIEGFTKLAKEVIAIDPDFGKLFIKILIEKRLFFLLDIYNEAN